MATMVSVRRDKSLSEDNVRVELMHPDGKCVKHFSTGDDDTVEDAVRRVQEDALKLSGAKFVIDYQIKVSVYGPSRCNVTLVDLPGFHNADDSDTKIVEDMVRILSLALCSHCSSF